MYILFFICLYFLNSLSHQITYVHNHKTDYMHCLPWIRHKACTKHLLVVEMPTFFVLPKNFVVLIRDIAFASKNPFSIIIIIIFIIFVPTDFALHLIYIHTYIYMYIRVPLKARCGQMLIADISTHTPYLYLGFSFCH